MDFPITELMDREACLEWLEEYFHPDGLKCPHCQAELDQANWFRKTKKSDLDVYRCKVCRGIYNLYSGTVFEGRYFTPEQTVLVHSRSAARQIFGETGTRVEDQPHHSDGSAASVASQRRTRTNDRTLERSGSRNRRNVPERRGKKENGTLIHRIHLDVERTNGVDAAHTRMIVHQFVP